MNTVKVSYFLVVNFWIKAVTWPISSNDRQIYSPVWLKLLNIYTLGEFFFILCHIMEMILPNILNR